MTGPGSLIVATLERAIADVRAVHPEVPEFVVITGSGASAGGLVWGHFGHQHWATGDGRRHELFVSGEALARPAAQTMTTLLHEITHAWCAEHGVTDTTSRGRYHNKKFVEAAQRFGLEWPEGKAPHPSIGFSAVVMTDQITARYASTIEAIGAGTAAWREALVLTGNGGDGDDDGEKRGKPKGGKGGGRKDGRVRPQCACSEPRSFYIARTVLARAGIRCEACKAMFTLPDDDAGQADG